mmetsp:Transcript_144/g.326  ORF Transcript_144/g.326 Transcript_144/m.326 type:complete len:230 (-) Transcript_144:718-1407(-)
MAEIVEGGIFGGFAVGALGAVVDAAEIGHLKKVPVAVPVVARVPIYPFHRHDTKRRPQVLPEIECGFFRKPHWARHALDREFLPDFQTGWVGIVPTHLVIRPCQVVFQKAESPLATRPSPGWYAAIDKVAPTIRELFFRVVRSETSVPPSATKWPPSITARMRLFAWRLQGSPRGGPTRNLAKTAPARIGGRKSRSNRRVCCWKHGCRLRGYKPLSAHGIFLSGEISEL